MKAKESENEGRPEAKYNILSNKVDVKAGKMTFGQRIDLGKILTSGISEYEMFKAVMNCLHKGFEFDKLNIEKYIQYCHEIVEGIIYWIQQESVFLNYEPSPEEIKAGIKELSKKIGEFGTVKALAEKYSRDPDEVLNWDYAKVFGLLYSDFEENKYAKRLHKQYTEKSKRK